jgi:hypothetical protein
LLNIFSKIFQEISSFIKIWQQLCIGSLRKDLCKFTITSCSILFTTRNVSEKCCRENQNTLCYITFLSSRTFYRKSRRLWDNVEKCCRSGHATWQYGACALHADYLRLPTHTQSMQFVSPFHSNNGFTT